MKKIPKIENQVLALGFGVSCIGLAFLADWLGTGVLQVKKIMMHSKKMTTAVMVMMITTRVMVVIITTMMMLN